jgi:hypothetical protein
MLSRLHTFIRSVLRKSRSAFVPPALITESINQGSYDLWRELIEEFRKSGKQSDLLSKFKSSSLLQGGTSLSPSGNRTHILSNKSQSVVTGITIIGTGSTEYPTRLLTSDSDWVMRKKLPFEDVGESLIKTTIITPTFQNQDHALPTDFMSHKGVIYTTNGSDNIKLRKGKIVSSEQFLEQTHPIDQTQIDFQNINEDLIKVETIATTDTNPSIGSLPTDYLSNTGVFYTADKKEGKILSPQDFLNKKKRIDEIKGQEESHIVRITVDSSIPEGATTGAKPLPENYASHTKVFYNSAGYEGIILSPKEFSERKNSAIISFDTNSPIATIYDQQIEILPAAPNYIFPYLALYSTENPIGTINNNVLEVLPRGQYNYKLPYIAKYTTENPIATILDNKITILPYSTNDNPISYVLPYVAHATDRLGYSRVYTSGASGLGIEIDTGTVVSSNVRIYMLDVPQTSTATYSYSKGVVSVSVGVDLNWDEAAFSNIANRALLYLGVSVDDKNATKLERQVNVNESDVVPRRGRANNPRN